MAGKKGKKKARAKAKPKNSAKLTSARKKKLLRAKKSVASAKAASKRARAKAGRARGRASDIGEPMFPRGRGLGPDSGGQSGDVQGLRGMALGDSESVEELVEDGQAYEAEVVSGVEDAPDPDEGEVRTREVPEDDVPSEYLDNQ